MSLACMLDYHHIYNHDIYPSISATEYIADDDRVGSIVSKYPLLASDACVEEMSSFFFLLPRTKRKKKADHIDGVALALQAQHSAVGYDRYGWRVAVAPKIPTRRRATATAHRPETVVVARTYANGNKPRTDSIYIDLLVTVVVDAKPGMCAYIC